MNNPLSISLGYIYRLLPDKPEFINESIKRIKDLPVNGVELAFQSQKRLDKLKLNDESIDFLSRLKHNTIHSPHLIEKNEPVLSKLEEIYKLVNAKNLVVHHSPIIKDLLKHEFKVSIENNDSRDKFNSVKEMKTVLEDNPELGLVFDLAHGYEAHGDNGLEFLDEFKEQLVECHVSILDNWNHWFLHLSNVDELMTEFKKRVRSNVILVNESVIWKEEQVNYFKPELDYLRCL
ncbi:MAG: hypothetical protein WC307_00430 [Candidatus Nanoarchaeia archaeon]